LRLRPFDQGQACDNRVVSDGELRNPFRSEADAFRLLTIVAVAGAIVIAAGLLVGSWLALVIAGVLLVLAIGPVVRWLRIAISDPDGRQGR